MLSCKFMVDLESVSQKNDPFWNLFENRKYRKYSKTFYIDLEYFNQLLFERLSVDHDDDDDDELDVDLYEIISELQNKKIGELKELYDVKCENDMDKNEELEDFFNSVQYGDCVDIAEYRRTGFFIVGYGIDTELKLIKTWSEYGYGIPLEFSDAKKNYFGEKDYELRQIDPMRLIPICESNDIQNNRNIKDYFYPSLYKNIYQTIVDRKIHQNGYYETKIDLNKFPVEYYAVYDGGNDEFTYFLKDGLIKDDEQKLCTLEWQQNYDKAIKKRRIRIQNYLSKNTKINSNILVEIVSFCV